MGLWRVAEGWHYVAGSVSLKRLMVRVQPLLQWRSQDTGDARTMGCPTETVAGMKWSCPEPIGQAVCALDGSSGETGYLKPLELRIS